MENPSTSRTNHYHENFKAWKKIKAAKKKGRLKAIQWTSHRGQKKLKERLLEKIKPYWDKPGVTFQDIEDELNSQNQTMMNAVKGIEEKNKRNIMMEKLVDVNFKFTVIIIILDIILYGDTLVKLIIKSFNMVAVLFLILANESFCSYQRKNIHDLYVIVKSLHDPNNKLINDILAHREEGVENIFETSIKLSLFISKIFKSVVLVLAVILFILKPVIITLITKKISDLLPFPVQIFFLNIDTVSGVALNAPHQYLTLFTLLRILVFAANYVFMLCVHGYFGAKSVESFIKSNSNTEVSEKQIWLGILVDATSLMTNSIKLGYETISNMLYFFEKVCYMEMVVLWLGIRVERGLLFVAIGQLPLVLGILVMALVNEVITEKYEGLSQIIYNLNWYKWRISDQKDLILIIAFLQKIPQMKAFVHEVTLDWFANFIKATYSTGTLMVELN